MYAELLEMLRTTCCTKIGSAQSGLLGLKAPAEESLECRASPPVKQLLFVFVYESTASLLIRLGHAEMDINTVAWSTLSYSWGEGLDVLGCTILRNGCGVLHRRRPWTTHRDVWPVRRGTVPCLKHGSTQLHPVE